MKKIIVLLICLSPLFAFSVKKPYDSASEYLVGGEKFVPDAAYGKHLCDLARFQCRKVRRGQTWKGLFSDRREREMVMRLNRTNVALMYRPFIVVPRDLSHTSYMDLAPFPQEYDTHGHRLLFVDLAVYAFAAYDKTGHLVFWGPATGGRPWCDDTQSACKTKTGHFHVYRMKGASCQSKTYPIEESGGAPMPYCMFYYKGFAIHGSTLSGFVDRSRGCVRLFDADAEWLNQHFVKIGTEVIVME